MTYSGSRCCAVPPSETRRGEGTDPQDGEQGKIWEGLSPGSSGAHEEGTRQVYRRDQSENSEILEHPPEAGGDGIGTTLEAMFY